MLIEFRVANFLSFEETATLSMVATSDKQHSNNNIIKINDKLGLLKSSAVYGANGAGKSNLIHALEFMRGFVLNSGGNSKHKKVPSHSYKLNLDTIDEPSYFEVVFLQNDTRFRYGFEVRDGSVVTEWLFHTPKTKEVPLFTREGKDIELHLKFTEAKGLKEKLHKNTLFLAHVAAYNNDDSIAQSVLDWFRWDLSVMNGSDLEDNLHMTMHLLEDHPEDNWKEYFLTLLQKLDILDDFVLTADDTSSSESDKLPKEKRVSYMGQDHSHADVIVKRKLYKGNEFVGMKDFNLLKDESEGTRKLFAFMGAVIGTLQMGGVLVIDELELRLHPLITKTIIELFNSSKSNNDSAQRIFTTHDTNLLSSRYFRRDQIWFVEKNTRGASNLFSLAEFKPRTDATYEKDYILGKYGAIPYISNFNDLIESMD